jgi:hypothetical protein
VSSTRVSHHGAPAAVAAGRVGPHVARTRRLLTWFCESLGQRYPFNAHRVVFLPEAALAASADDAGDDVWAMAGLTLMPDAVLSSERAPDADAAAHAGAALGVASTWFGCALCSARWVDAWVTRGVAGFLVGRYFASFRGAGEWELDLARRGEALGRLEREHPELLPLRPPDALAGGAAAWAALGPLRDAYVALKAPAVVHAIAGAVGDARFVRALGALAAKVLAAPLDGWATALLEGADRGGAGGGGPACVEGGTVGG